MVSGAFQLSQSPMVHDPLTPASPLVNGPCANRQTVGRTLCGVPTDAKWREMIGLRIKSLREQRGMSQRDLERATRTLGKSRIGNYEQGTRMPGPEEATILGRALGVPACVVLCLDHDPPLPIHLRSQQKESTLPPEWVTIYNLLYPEERQSVISAAKMRLRDRGVNLERVLESPSERVDRLADDMPSVRDESVYEVSKDSDLHGTMRETDNGEDHREGARRGPSGKRASPKRKTSKRG